MVCPTLNKVETKLILFRGPTWPSSKTSESAQPIPKHKIYCFFLDFEDVDYSSDDITTCRPSKPFGDQIDLCVKWLRISKPF